MGIHSPVQKLAVTSSLECLYNPLASLCAKPFNQSAEQGQWAITINSRYSTAKNLLFFVGRKKSETGTVDMSEPEVGIFFIVGAELFRESTPLSGAKRFGDDVLIHPVEHRDFWEEIRRGSSLLSDVPYDFYPRGRVLFRLADRRFWVYVDRSTHKDRGRILSILSEFHLPQDKTRIRCDPRYKRLVCNPHDVPYAIGLDIDDYLP